MRRRRFLGASLSLAGAAVLHVPPARAGAIGRVRPGMPGWPTDADWATLKQAVGGRFSPVTLPNFEDPAVRARRPVLHRRAARPHAELGLAGRLAIFAQRLCGRGRERPDVAAAIRFARAHNIRLVVRGGGHSYLGTSNAPDSLLLWTRRMNAVTVHDAFTPEGSAAPVPAVSAGAGCIWLHLYQAVTGGAGRYVQGGGCTTVGVPGLVQGGGFGSFSKAFGTVAASLLEAEIVTADGETHIVSSAREPDLFWALKGGGGGTLGVVTRVTLATRTPRDLWRRAPCPSGALRRGIPSAPRPLCRLLRDQSLQSALGRAGDRAARQPPADPDGFSGPHAGRGALPGSR